MGLALEICYPDEIRPFHRLRSQPENRERLAMAVTRSTFDGTFQRNTIAMSAAADSGAD